MIRMVLSGLLALSLLGAAGAQDWRPVTGGPAGWSLLEVGEPLARPESSGVWVQYKGNGTGLIYGCKGGQTVVVMWRPSRALQNPGASGLPVSLTVNGAPVGTLTMRTSGDGIWEWEGAGGAGVLGFLEGMNTARKGVIALSGGGVSDTVAFDEDQNGGTAEYALMVCGL